MFSWKIKKAPYVLAYIKSARKELLSMLLTILTNTFRGLNNYFFDEEEISLHDSLWFYGVIGFMLLVAVCIWLD